MCSSKACMNILGYYASNSDHEHGYESGMNKGYGREGMKKRDNDMRGMENG